MENYLIWIKEPADVRYHRRTLVETKFSVLKRKFGGDLKTRKFSNQRKELSCKMIICNLHQFLQFVMIEVFYRAIISFYNFAVFRLDLTLLTPFVSQGTHRSIFSSKIR